MTGSGRSGRGLPGCAVGGQLGEMTVTARPPFEHDRAERRQARHQREQGHDRDPDPARPDRQLPLHGVPLELDCRDEGHDHEEHEDDPVDHSRLGDRLVVVVDPLDDHGDQQDRPGDRLGDGDEPEALGGCGQVEE